MPAPGQKKKYKWEPAHIIKPKDNLVSSDFANADRFVASYEDKDINMFHLMAMEYGKVWRYERETNWGIVLLATQDDGFLQRRYVIRGLLKKKQKEQSGKQIVRYKKYDHIQSKIKPLVDVGRCQALKKEGADEAAKDCMKQVKCLADKEEKG